MKTMVESAVRAALSAGREILDVYATDVSVECKCDVSPLTLADRRSHQAIEESLRGVGMPILSEEGEEIPFEQRRGWKRLWIVDPLDGTKEFIKKNGEFTVNIALVDGGYPVLGVIYVPVTGALYYAADGLGAWRAAVPVAGSSGVPSMEEIQREAERLPRSFRHDRPFRIVASRSHLSPETEAFIREQEERSGKAELVSMGSSLKICLVAEGNADMYPRLPRPWSGIPLPVRPSPKLPGGPWSSIGRVPGCGTIGSNCGTTGSSSADPLRMAGRRWPRPTYPSSANTLMCRGRT